LRWKTERTSQLVKRGLAQPSSQEQLFSGGSNSFMQNARNLREQRGRSDFDYRHRWVTSYIYEVPFGKGKTYLTEGTASHVLGGWRISRVTNLRSGRPFSIFAGANNSLVGNRGGLANALADCVTDGALPTDEHNVDRWFDARGYSVPTPARLGNCGRNTLDGPGLVNFDFALARSFVKYNSVFHGPALASSSGSLAPDRRNGCAPLARNR